MSSSSGPVASTKTDSATKPAKSAYDHLSINKLYKGKTSETVTKTVTQKHGMQTLGKVIPARRPGQIGSVKSENTSADTNNSVNHAQSGANAVTSNQSQVHPLSSHHPPAGWTGSAPPPPRASSSPRPAQIAQGIGHPQDKSWNGNADRMNSYPSQRFAQEFPSLEAGMETKTSSQHQSGPKGQDNQYGPGPVLRPQTEGSWTQGGARSTGRPGPGGPADFPGLNAAREYQGQDRGNAGGPAPIPMSLGQGGPNQPMNNYGMPPFRGMMPPNSFMYPNGPPGPGMFYPGMPRMGMPVPPRPPVAADAPREQRDYQRGNKRNDTQRPSNHFANKPIIRDEDLKRMDEIVLQDGGWASVQDEVDYSRTISFGSDDEEPKLESRAASKGHRNSYRDEEDDSNREDRYYEQKPRILERPGNVASGSEKGVEDRRSREGFERERYQRGENGSKDRNREGAAEVDRKPQQGYRRSYEDKEKDDRRNNIDRGGRRRDEQGGASWRSTSARQYDDGKGPQPRGETRGADFGKSHMTNLPPRLLRQQMNSSGTSQSQPSANSQRQTPSPVPAGKDKDGRNDWESDPERRRDSRKEAPRDRRADAENRNEERRSIPKDSSDSSYSRSKDTTGDDFRGYSSSKGKMSWADEMDDYETTSTKESDDTHGRKPKTSPESRYSGTSYVEPDFYPKEERRARVIIGKHQRKVADMQLEKVEPEPPKEKPQPVAAPAPTPPMEDKVAEEPQESLSKPVSAWGERETRDKIMKTEGYSDRDDRKSMDRETSLHKSPSSSSVPGKGLDDSSSSVISDETLERLKMSESGKFVQESERHLEGRRESVSDISDRDHFDKDSVSSQDARGRRGPVYRGAHDKYGNMERQKPRFERKDRDRFHGDRDEGEDGSLTDRGTRGGGRGRFQHHNVRGTGRPFDRPGLRGSRGRGGGQYHDRPVRRNEGESEAKEFQEPRIERTHNSDVLIDKNGVENKPKDTNLEEMEQQINRRDKEQDKKYVKGYPAKKEKLEHQKGAKGGSKIEGYGPPSDQKPFSTSRNKQGTPDESSRPKDKPDEIPNKEGQIPSLMAFEISPPTIPQYKGKGAREREFHAVSSPRGGMPPRMQRNSGSDYGDRDRDRYSGRSKRGAKSGSARRKGDEDASEDITDNESDNESRKSTASGKTRKDSGESQGKKKSTTNSKALAQEKSEISDASSDKAKAADKKPKQVKYPPYDARSVQQQLPPRMVNKQRDSQSEDGTTNGTSSPPAKDVVAEKDQTIHSANNAWEKPIGSFQKAVGPNVASPTPQNVEAKEQPRESILVSQTMGVPPASASPVVGSSAAATAMLDGTNPPAQTMIFENRNFKGFTDLSKSSAVKLPESKKDVLEAAKALQGLSFGKVGMEGASDLNFGTFGDTTDLSQPPSSVGKTITSHANAAKISTASMLQQTARHAFNDHQSPISPMAQELTEKIQQVKKVWETNTTSMIHDQSGVLTPFEVDVPFHGSFGTDSYKADGSGRAEFGANPLQQTGFSGGSSPLSAIAKPESSSSPSSVASRQTSKIGPAQHTMVKGPGPSAPIATPFNNYGVDTQNSLGTKGFGNLSVVQQQKVIYQSNVPVSVDPFSSQFTQFANPGINPGIPYSQSGSMMVRQVDPKPMYNMYGQPQPQVNQVATQSLSGANHSSVSPGPGNNSSSIGGASVGAPGSHMNRSNLPQKPTQQNRNTGVMNQSLSHPQPGYYHGHPNALSQQQLHKGAFPPSIGGFTDGSTLAAYQAQHQVLIPMENPQYNFDSGELRAGPPGPVNSGTPPVQSGSNHYFGSNNNPLMYQSNNPPQSYGYGHPFGQSMKLPFNSTSGAADSGSNMSAQRMRDHHSYLPGTMPTGLDGLQQNMMKPNDYLLSQQRWSNDYSQPMWTPTPIQRPIFQPSNQQVMSNMVPSSHYSVPGHGHVGAKPQSQSNDSMGNNTG